MSIGGISSIYLKIYIKTSISEQKNKNKETLFWTLDPDSVNQSVDPNSRSAALPYGYFIAA